MDEEDKIKVFFVDFGSTHTIPLVPWDNVLRLDKRFLHEPFQAVECHLANVVPIDAVHPKWSKQAKDYFMKQIINKTLVIQVCYLMPEGQPAVDLWDTTGGNLYVNPTTDLKTLSEPAADVLVNEELIVRGFARKLGDEMSIIASRTSTPSLAR
jgi:hypothetical protein